MVHNSKLHVLHHQIKQPSLNFHQFSCTVIGSHGKHFCNHDQLKNQPFCGNMYYNGYCMYSLRIIEWHVHTYLVKLVIKYSYTERRYG